jgi:hypothetical protein
MVESLSLKVNYMNKKPFKITYLEAELDAATTEMATILKDNYEVIQAIESCADKTNFLWESHFIELLTPDERKKYLSFNLVSFDAKKYFQQKDMYDAELPYFSKIEWFLSLTQYVGYINKRLRQLDAIPQQESPEASKPSVKPELEKPKPNRTLESKLDENQITILYECLIEIRVFSEPITEELVYKLFSDTLDSPLKLARNKNKLLVYLFWQLESRGYITIEWQAVCAQAQLFKSIKGIILSQNNLSSTLYQVKEYPPKDCQIIDKYIKELKEH